MYTYTTQKQVRAAFWESHPELQRLRRPGDQNAQLVGVRMDWIDYVDALVSNGDISEALARRVTL